MLANGMSDSAIVRFAAVARDSARLDAVGYLALARLLRCQLLTTDAKLKNAGTRVVRVIGPTELQSE